MAPSKNTGKKAPRKASQAQQQFKGQHSQNLTNIPLASFGCFFCKGEKPLEEQVPGRKLPTCTNCHKHYTAVISERAQAAAAVSSPLPSSPSPPSTPLHQSPVRPATVIGPSEVPKKEKTTQKRLEAPKQPDAIVGQSQRPTKIVKLRLTAPKRPKPILFLSLSGREKIPLSFPSPLQKRKV